MWTSTFVDDLVTDGEPRENLLANIRTEWQTKLETTFPTEIIDSHIAIMEMRRSVTIRKIKEERDRWLMTLEELRSKYRLLNGGHGTDDVIDSADTSAASLSKKSFIFDSALKPIALAIVNTDDGTYVDDDNCVHNVSNRNNRWICNDAVVDQSDTMPYSFLQLNTMLTPYQEYFLKDDLTDHVRQNIETVIGLCNNAQSGI